MQFEDEVTLSGNRRGHFGIGRFDVTELASVLCNIFVLNTLFIKEATRKGFRQFRIVFLDQHIEVQVTAVFGAYVGIESLDV